MASAAADQELLLQLERYYRDRDEFAPRPEPLDGGWEALPVETDGWSYALEMVSRFLDRVSETSPPEDMSASPADDDVPVWLEEVAPEMLSLARLLGIRTGELHQALAEAEAINRAITLARFVDAPLLIVHVSTPEGAALVRDARAAGAKIFGETCPQYLFLTRDDLDRPGMDGAMFMCSPPVRDAHTQDVLWRHIQTGTFTVVSSDHAPYRFDETGKLAAGPDAPFKKIANGMPGIAIRLPLLFSEGVVKGRISLQQFVALSATNAARIYGMHPRKGTIAIGADADIAIWDPEATRTVRLADQHEVERIAFPALSTGAFGYPLDEAAEAAVGVGARAEGVCGLAAGALVGPGRRGHEEVAELVLAQRALEEQAVALGRELGSPDRPVVLGRWHSWP